MKMESVLSKDFLSQYQGKQPNWGFNGLGYIVYKRTYARQIENNGKEEWWQTVARCIEGAQKIGAGYTTAEAERLYDLVFNLKCSFAGRMLWQLGTPTVDRFGANSLLNCWYVSITKPEDFLFIFENLMLGGGVGFSVRREDVHELPRILHNVEITHNQEKDADFIVPDSREGWIETLRKVLDAYFVTGKSFSYSTVLVRGAGEPINGFGGTASGPQILHEGIEQICKVLEGRSGKKLRSVDVLDICNIIGSIVVAGNVRRSAEIAIGDPDDYLFIRAKNWSTGNIPDWRRHSNNTIEADSFDHISNEIWSLGYEIDPKTGMAKGEPYGFFNLPLSQRKGRLKDAPQKDNCEGLNPCVTSDTWVMTRNGARQVKDLIGKKFKAIHNGGEYDSVSEGFWKTGTKPVYKVTTDKGYSLRLTDNHKLLSDGEWKELKDLSIGDRLTLENHGYLSWGDKNKKNKGWLLGSLVGDGTFDSEKAILAYWGESRFDMLLKASSILQKEFNSRADLGSTKIEAEPARLGSSELTKFAEKYGISRRNKFNTSKIEEESSSFIEGFIQGIMDADGSVQGTIEKGYSLRLTSICLPMLESIQRMLLRLGMVSKIYKNRKEAGWRDMPDGKGGHKPYYCNATHELIISKNSIITYYDRISFSDREKESKLYSLVNSYSRAPYKDKFEDRIVSISEDGFEDVYDVTIDNVHCFDANGIVAHNCAEITLSSYECCNLVELFLNNIESEEELWDCARLLYKTQKAIAAMPFIHEETNKIVHKNMRLGMGVTGVCQAMNKVFWLDKCYEKLREFDKEWSAQNNWSESVKLTTVKPSGTLSLLAGASAGIHPAYSRYWIRRVQIAANDPLVKICQDLGYNTEFRLRFDGSVDYSTVIVEFPCHSCDNAILAEDMGVIEQLELVKNIQTVWADNSVSVTAYYRPEDLDSIKEWMKKNYKDSIKSVSFLLKDEHGFKQAPYESIDEKRYKRISSRVKPIESLNFDDFGSEILNNLECEGGACPIK